MDTCQDYVGQKLQRGQAPREVRLDRQPWSWGRLQGRRAKHLLVSRSLTMRRALDHGCLVTGIYNLADACCPQRHERKYGRVGTVLLILPAPTYHALTLSCGALGPEAPTSRDKGHPLRCLEAVSLLSTATSNGRRSGVACRGARERKASASRELATRAREVCESARYVDERLMHQMSSPL